MKTKKIMRLLANIKQIITTKMFFCHLHELVTSLLSSLLNYTHCLQCSRRKEQRVNFACLLFNNCLAAKLKTTLTIQCPEGSLDSWLSWLWSFSCSLCRLALFPNEVLWWERNNNLHENVIPWWMLTVYRYFHVCNS